MQNTMFIWFFVAGILLAVFILHSIRCRLKVRHHTWHNHTHFLGMAKDREIFFIPGDSDDDDDE